MQEILLTLKEQIYGCPSQTVTGKSGKVDFNS